MGALGAAGLLLRRIRDERGILLLAAVLIAATSFVFAAAPRAFNRVADDAARYALSVAPATQRNLALAVTSAISPGPQGGVAGPRAEGARLADRFPESVDSVIAERPLRVTTVRFLVVDPPSYQTHLSLRYQDGLTEETRLVSGRWPVDHGAVLRGTYTYDEQPVEPLPAIVLEAALSADSAAEIGVALGDRLDIEMDFSDLTVRGLPFLLGPTAVEIVGLYEPLDPNADAWAGDTGLLQVAQRGTQDNPIAYATAYVPAEMYPNLAASELPFHYEWRFHVDPQRLDASQVDQLRLDLRRLVRSGFPPTTIGEDVTLRTGLPRILDRYVAERALSEAVLSVAAIGPLGLAAGALTMVAILAVRRRTRTLALARGRGASGALVLGTQLWEGVLLAGGGAIAGMALAIAAVGGRPAPLSPVLATTIAGAAVALLLGASWAVARRPLGALERDDPPVLRVSPRRLVIEATIVLIAVGASLLLQQRGLLLDEESGVARFDPLLASVPVLCGLAAGIVAVRLYPLPVRALGWLAARRRDIVPVLGLRAIGRHPASANLPLLVLMLTAAFGAFASVVASSLTRGQDGASSIEVGADYRLERIGLGALGPSIDPAAVPGVEAVAEAVFDPSAAFSSTVRQRASIPVIAIDARGYDTVASGSAAAPAWPAAFAEPPQGSIGTEDNPIPAILSRNLPTGSAALAPGDTFRMKLGTQTLTYRVVERRESFPGPGDRPTFALVPLDWVRAATGEALPPTVLWVRAPAEVAGPLGEAIGAARGSTRVVSRYDVLADLREAPFSIAIPAGYLVALAIAAGYMALTVIGAMVLSAARRTQDLAYLRALGFSAPQALGLTFMEHAPPVLLAVVPGVALGIGIALLCVPGLGLAAFVGSRGEVPLFVDWPGLAALVGVLLAVVAVAVTAGAWLSGRARLVDALRSGEN